jgi:tetratricopeptide (TPR) repeat protein
MGSASTDRHVDDTDRPLVTRTIAVVRALLKDGKAAEAEAAVALALASYPDRPALLRLAAGVAEQRADMDAALARWEAVRAAEPDAPAGYVGAVRCLRKFGRADLALPILQEGRARLWDNLEFVVAAAHLAASMQKVEEAEEAWKRAAELDPGNADYALSAVTALLGPRKGRPERLRTIVERLEAHHRRFPDFVPAYSAHIDALRELHHLPEADRLSALWCARFPADVRLALARAGVHEDMGHADKALADVTALRARTAASQEVEAAYVRALSCAGRHAEAEAACAAALRTWPEERTVWVEYARIASRQGDWTESVHRLEEARRAMPKDEALARELSLVRTQLADPNEDGGDGGTSLDEELAPVADGLFGRFESLGGSGMGCEFGMVQRRLGSDTVSLLRWARINPPEIIAALECEFAGVGDEAFTELDSTRVSADREEYITRDKRFVMESHTFVRTSDAPADRMYQQTCRRLQFLKRKLLEDLRAAERIFVYRAQFPIDDGTILAMHARLAHYGDNALLCVMRADEANRAGSVRQIARGVFAGYVAHFLRDPGAHTGSDIDGWSSVCADADARWRATRGSGA